MAARARILASALRARSAPAARRMASSGHGAGAKKSSDMPWMIGSAAVFVPVGYYLLGPDAPGKHDDGHHEHSDHGRALYLRNPSREPKWTEEDEAEDRQRSGEDDEDDEESADDAETDGESGPDTPADSDDDDSSSSSGGSGKRPQQADAQKPASNRTTRAADPDKLQEATSQQIGKQHADPKAFIEGFRDRKAKGETRGEKALQGGKGESGKFAPNDPYTDEAKERTKKDDEDYEKN